MPFHWHQRQRRDHEARGDAHQLAEQREGHVQQRKGEGDRVLVARRDQLVGEVHHGHASPQDAAGEGRQEQGGSSTQTQGRAAVNGWFVQQGR